MAAATELIHDTTPVDELIVRPATAPLKIAHDAIVPPLFVRAATVPPLPPDAPVDDRSARLGSASPPVMRSDGLTVP